ncbi:MAG: hypothetical protein ABI746_05075, partial [Dermatophilaceae bacterium]
VDVDVAESRVATVVLGHLQGALAVGLPLSPAAGEAGVVGKVAVGELPRAVEVCRPGVFDGLAVFDGAEGARVGPDSTMTVIDPSMSGGTSTVIGAPEVVAGGEGAASGESPVPAPPSAPSTPGAVAADPSGVAVRPAAEPRPEGAAVGTPRGDGTEVLVASGVGHGASAAGGPLAVEVAAGSVSDEAPAPGVRLPVPLLGGAVSGASRGDGAVLGMFGWFVGALAPDRSFAPGVGGAPVVSRAVGDAVCSACPEAVGVAGISRGLVGAGGFGAGRGGSGGSVETGASVPSVESVDFAGWSAVARPSDPLDGVADGCWSGVAGAACRSTSMSSPDRSVARYPSETIGILSEAGASDARALGVEFAAGSVGEVAAWAEPVPASAPDRATVAARGRDAAISRMRRVGVMLLLVLVFGSRRKVVGMGYVGCRGGVWS